MRPSIVLAIALLSGSIPLAAQQGSSGVATSQGPVRNIPQNFTITIPITVSAPQLTNCPAMLTARHLSDGSVIRTGSRTGTGPTHPKGIGQWLHIALNVSQGALATLAVHGFSNKGRMTEANLGSSPDAVRTVTVYLAPAQNGQTGGDVWAPGLTAVASLDLVSLNYDDGTSWSAPDGRTCRVTPDPLMLISAR
jgi:hypothetical protein